MAAVSHLAAFMASEKAAKRKFFRKSFVYKDLNWATPSVVTVTNTGYGLLGSVSMLHGIYKQKINFGQLGLAVFQTTAPARPKRLADRKSGDKDTMDAVAIFDLDSFISSFVQHDELANFLEAKCAEVMAEWRADNAGKEKMGSRVPIERVFSFAKYSWEGKTKKKEESEYDIQLSTYGFTAANQHKDVPEQMGLNHIKVRARFLFSPSCLLLHPQPTKLRFS
jgi:hypothetical protein